MNTTVIVVFILLFLFSAGNLKNFGGGVDDGFKSSPPKSPKLNHRNGRPTYTTTDKGEVR